MFLGVRGAHEAFLVHVRQVDPGSSDDAWTAPIWIDPGLAAESEEHTELPAVQPTTKFVGSKNSSVYHFPECSTVRRIKASNLREYADAPAGKRLHSNCPLN